MAKFVSLSDVKEHNKADDAWIILDGKVYDVTPYVKAHPGGDAILRNVGGDATDGFHGQLAHGVVRTFIENSLEKFYVGTLLPQKRKWEETEKKEEECVS